MSVLFDDSISKLDRLRFKNLDEMFRDYADGALLGEEIDPFEMPPICSTQRTISSVEDIDEIEVLEVDHIEEREFEVRCQVSLLLELDLNDEEQNTDMSYATLELTLRVDLTERKIRGHYLVRAYVLE